MRSRRNCLKSAAKLGTGIALVGSTGVVSSQSKSTSVTQDLVTTPQKTWTESHYYESDYTAECETASSLNWYSSAWLPSRGWIHDFGYFASSIVRNKYSGKDMNAIEKQNTLVQTIDPDDQNVNPVQTSDYCGAYPSSTSGSLPYWVKTPAELALSLYSPKYAFAVAASQIDDAMTPEDGYSYHKGSYEFKHSSSSWSVNGWSDCAQFQRFNYSTDQSWTIERDLFVETRTETSTFWVEIQIDVSIFEDDEPERTNSTKSISESSLSKTDYDPREMTDEEKRHFGIKEISKPGALVQESSGENGSMFIATDIPISVEIKPKNPKIE